MPFRDFTQQRMQGMPFGIQRIVAQNQATRMRGRFGAGAQHKIIGHAIIWIKVEFAGISIYDDFTGAVFELEPNQGLEKPGMFVAKIIQKQNAQRRRCSSNIRIGQTNPEKNIGDAQR